MKKTNITGRSVISSLVVAAAMLALGQEARANVYATDIQVNSTLTNSVTVSKGGTFTLTYHLNDNATAGVTVNILSGSSVVSSTNIAYPGTGTALGLNTLSLTAPNAFGNYSVSIMAASTGYTNWQQISSDSNSNNYAFFPNGIAVDCNPSSPFYGRVIVGCSTEGSNSLGVYYKDGLYKYNGDATPADEGVFGYGGYSEDDAGNLASQAGEMPSVSTVVPWRLRISDDDRIYMLDYSDEGAVSSIDMMASNFTVVIDEGIEGYLSTIAPSNNYSRNPDFGTLSFGIGVFDVSGAGTTHGAVWLCNNDYNTGANPFNWGIWEYHLTNGVADPADNVGTQAVYAGAGSVMDLVSSGGCFVDSNLDIFCSQSRFNPTATDAESMVFTNWNSGVFPPEGSGTNFMDTTNVGWAAYAASLTDYSWEEISDTVINSRSKPTLVALPLGFGNNNTNGGGIKLVNALNATIKIAGVAASGTNIILTCAASSPNAVAASQLSLFGSPSANGTYSPVTNISASGGNGVFQITTPVNGSMEYYQVAIPPTAGKIAAGTATTGSVTQGLTNIDFGNVYTCAAFDNVGNLYGASTTTNLWRVWSPPGPNTNTTTAVVILSIQPAS